MTKKINKLGSNAIELTPKHYNALAVAINGLIDEVEKINKKEVKEVKGLKVEDKPAATINDVVIEEKPIKVTPKKKSKKQ